MAAGSVEPDLRRGGGVKRRPAFPGGARGGACAARPAARRLKTASSGSPLAEVRPACGRPPPRLPVLWAAGRDYCWVLDSCCLALLANFDGVHFLIVRSTPVFSLSSRLQAAYVTQFTGNLLKKIILKLKLF